MSGMLGRCPACEYSFQGLGRIDTCPECGIDIRYEILESDAFEKSVRLTRTWSLIGLISSPIVAFGYWFVSMAIHSISVIYNPQSVGPYDEFGIHLRTSIVIAPIALFFGWRRNAKLKIYLRALRKREDADVLWWPIVLGFLLMLGAIGVCGCGVFLVLMSA